MQDEIGTCPQSQVHLKLSDETPFFVRPYPIREEQKSIVKWEMDWLVNLGIIKKGLTGYSSPVLSVKRKQQNLFRVCTDFKVLNDRLANTNHAFPYYGSPTYYYLRLGMGISASPAILQQFVGWCP